MKNTKSVQIDFPTAIKIKYKANFAKPSITRQLNSH